MNNSKDSHPEGKPRDIKVQAPAPHLDDLKLAQDCIDGDRDRWAELLRLHERTVHFAILNTLRAQNARLDPDWIADIQGDLVVALSKERFRKLRLYSGRCRLGQWLKVVACNYTIDALRRERPIISLSSDDPLSEGLRQTLVSPDASPDAVVQHEQLLAILRTLYTELPPEDQRFIALFFDQELTFTQVAQEMNTTLDAVYTRKNRVRNRLLRLARKRGYLKSKTPKSSSGGR